MSEAPQLHLKCTGRNRHNDWWVIGKLYPVVDGAVYATPSPSGKSVFLGPHPVARALGGHLSGDFVAVWVLPDGTELEALS